MYIGKTIILAFPGLFTLLTVKGATTEYGIIYDSLKYIVKYKNGIGRESINKLSAKSSSHSVLVTGEIPSKNLMTVTITKDVLKKFESNPNIEYVEPDYVQSVNGWLDRGSMNDNVRKLSEQTPYGVDMVQATILDNGDTQMKICVVDTGYGKGHPDLPDNNDSNNPKFNLDGWNSPSNNNGLWNVDGHGHGSHCAGTIGAIGDNELGVTSVNPKPDNIEFFIGKGLSDQGTGTSSNVLNAVQSCVDNGAKIISLSLGGGNFQQSAFDLFKDIYDEDILIIAAAGNDGNSGDHYPASYPFLMSVGAVDSNENLAGFSVYNSQTEISAPGVGVKSTVTSNGGVSFSYATWSGTSMACPHVAGVAALVWSHFPQCQNNQIRNALIRSAKDKGAEGCDTYYGHGIVQAKDAYDLLLEEGCEAGGPAASGNTKRSDLSMGGCLQDPSITGSPTPVPTPCTGKFMGLDITTDNFGSETTWEVRDMNENLKKSSSRTFQDNTNHVETECFASNECFVFTIKDEWGDGICCDYGEGSYTLAWDGNILRNGGVFEAQESTRFGDACDQMSFSPSSYAPSTNQPNSYYPTPITETDYPTESTLLPTAGPTTEVTHFPSVTPTEVNRFPTVAPTEATNFPTATTTPGCTNFTLTLATDNFGTETTWMIEEVNSGNPSEPIMQKSNDRSSTTISGGPYAKKQNDVIVSTSCLPLGEYIFDIHDEHNDGICCEYGIGNYTLMVNNTLIHVGGIFQSSETIPFVISGTPVKYKFEMSLITDNYPHEISWELRNNIDNSVMMEAPQGTYQRRGVQPLVELDLDMGCYTLFLYDSWEDGICCQYGEGSYNMYLDGIPVVSQGGNFNRTASYQFGSTCSETTRTLQPNPPPVDEDMSNTRKGEKIKCEPLCHEAESAAIPWRAKSGTRICNTTPYYSKCRGCGECEQKCLQYCFSRANPWSEKCTWENKCDCPIAECYEELNSVEQSC